MHLGGGVHPSMHLGSGMCGKRGVGGEWCGLGVWTAGVWTVGWTIGFILCTSPTSGQMATEVGGMHPTGMHTHTSSVLVDIHDILEREKELYFQLKLMLPLTNCKILAHT